MINRKVDDAVFDAILKQAFCDAFAQEIEQIEAADDQPAKPSEVQRKQERRYYRKFQRKPVKAATILRGTAACLVALMGLSFCLMLTSAPVRAAMVDTVVSFFEKYLTVSLSEAEDAVMLGEHTMSYVPKGFALVETYDMAYFDIYIFSNGTENFKVYFYSEKDFSVKYDNEQTNLTLVNINKGNGYFVNREDGTSVLFWNMNDQTISIESNLNLNIMKKIAENIS